MRRIGTYTVICAAIGLLLAGSPFAQVSKGTSEARAEFDKGQEAVKQKQTDVALTAFRKAIGIDSRFFEAHARFVALTSGRFEKNDDASAELRRIYGEWLAKEPKNAVLHYFLGTFEDDPDKSRPHYVQAVELDPGFTEAYQRLAGNAQMRGENELSSAYWKKAAESRPDDVSYLFNYAYSLSERDPAQWTRLALSVVDKSPNAERGAQALYWLGEKARTRDEAIKYFERLRREYAPEKSSWCESGMQSLFAIHANADPQKALDVVHYLVEHKVQSYMKWDEIATAQEHVVQARKLLDEKRPADALALLNTTKAPDWYVVSDQLRLVTAEAETALGDGQKAYDEMADLVAATPRPVVYDALVAQARRVGRTTAQLNTDLQARREKQAKEFQDFDLESFVDGSRVSLAKYRGKVVLLNFWFPG